MLPTESREMPDSEIDVMAASAEDNIQIDIKENQKSAKKNTEDKMFNKVNYNFPKWIWYSLANCEFSTSVIFSIKIQDHFKIQK